MAGILGINQIQNSEVKKSYSKLSFKVGETFSGKVVSEDESKGEVVLKTSDGWQFPAKIDKPLKDVTDKQFLKFEVEGLEDGKLKIKVVLEENIQADNLMDPLEEISKEVNIGLSKEDNILMQKMIKSGIPLTKENIAELKNLMDFRNKIINNSSQEDNFIEKYLKSRNIELNSEQGKDISKILKGFFNELKKLSLEDILLLKQNNIELTEKNMKCFNNIFKEANSIYKDIKEIKNNLEQNSMENFKDIDLHEDVNINKNDNGKIDNKSNVNSDKKTDMQVKGSEVNILAEKNNSVESKQIINNENIIKNQNAESINKNINKDFVENINQDFFESIDEEFIKNITKEASDIDNLSKSSNSELINDKKLNFKSDISKITTDVLANNEIKMKMEELKNTIKLFVKDEVNFNLDGNKINILESKINNILNEIVNKENTNINFNKEASKHNVNELTTDVLANNEIKMQMEDLKSTINNLIKGEVNFKSNGDNKNMNILENKINDILNEFVNEKNTNIDLNKEIINRDSNKVTTDALVKNEIKTKTEELKNIIKFFIKDDANLKSDSYNKVMNILENRINDIKIFNSISEQYYYLDLPVNVKDNSYECKLIIKDDRGKGKKIDSKNVRIATSIKTINMGVVDAYIKIYNNNMNIDIKCEEMWKNPLQMGKDKLIKALSKIQYNISIDVSEKEKEFGLANCSEFFDDRDLSAINIKV